MIGICGSYIALIAYIKHVVELCKPLGVWKFSVCLSEQLIAISPLVASAMNYFTYRNNGYVKPT